MQRKRNALLLLVAGVIFPLLYAAQTTEPPDAHTQNAAIPPGNRVDLNHASLEQLMKVPGMKRTWAERIVRFRPYRSKQDLVDQGILPGDVYSRIRDFVIAHRDKN